MTHSLTLVLYKRLLLSYVIAHDYKSTSMSRRSGAFGKKKLGGFLMSFQLCHSIPKSRYFSLNTKQQVVDYTLESLKNCQIFNTDITTYT